MHVIDVFDYRCVFECGFQIEKAGKFFFFRTGIEIWAREIAHDTCTAFDFLKKEVAEVGFVNGE